MVIRLRDVSSKTNELKVIASNTFNASLFPIQYNITYNPSIIIQSHIHVIDAIILNDENIKTFQSDRSVAVNLLGPGRTTYLDISLRAVFRKSFLIDSKSIEMYFFASSSFLDQHSMVFQCITCVNGLNFSERKEQKLWKSLKKKQVKQLDFDKNECTNEQ